MNIKLDDMCLRTVQTIHVGEENDVYVCKNETAITETYYTLLYVKNHVYAKQLIDLFENNDMNYGVMKKVFAYENGFCFLFDYEKERPLEEFYMGRVFSLYKCEMICINLVLKCLSATLPYPLLYLVLTQGKVNISADDGIYYSYYFDLSDFDYERNEKDCVLACAVLVRKLLKEHEEEKATSFNLISRKINREGYQKFSELYKDIRLSSTKEKKKGILNSLRRFMKKNDSTFTRIVIGMAITLGIITIISFVSQKLFGYNILTRFFMNPFLKIGTESMLQ